MTLPALRRRRDLARFLAGAGAVAAALYAVLYFPYATGTPGNRALTKYVHILAGATAAVLRAIDYDVIARGTFIGGRFPMEIVLDCSALDVQAVYVAAVAAFPACWRARVSGAVGGLLAINVANLARIVLLYLVGVHRPASFHFLHEDVLQLAMVAVGGASFAAWLLWSRWRSIDRAA